MFRVDDNDKQVTIQFSSRLELIDRAIAESQDYFKRLNMLCGENVEILLRELLVNAVEHGNKNDILLAVTLVITQLGNKKRFEIVVSDQGSGFDTTTIDLNPRQNPTQKRGRGYSIVNAYADEIKFDNNGATVKTYITLSELTQFDMQFDGQVCTATPSGNLTASNIEELRRGLVEMANKKCMLFVFDFGHVEGIDSVSLSMLINFHNYLIGISAAAKVSFVNVGDDIVSLFMMTRMNEIFTVTMRGKDGVA